MTKGMSNARIGFHLDVHEPIDIDDLTNSFQAVASEYKNFITEKMRKSGEKDKNFDVKLYVTNIENNCILAELASSTEIMGQLFETWNQLDTFKVFVGNFSEAIRTFREVAKLGYISTSDFPYSKKRTKSIADILNTVEKNKNGSLNLSVIEYEEKSKKGTERLRIKFSSNQVSKANKGARIITEAYEEAEKKVTETIHENVLMQLHQASIDELKSKSKTAFRGIIKKIEDTVLPVDFLSPTDCAEMRRIIKKPKENPFTVFYSVDVNVEVDQNGNSKSYRILKIHGTIPNKIKSSKKPATLL